jgi:putative transcriptional regulator
MSVAVMTARWRLAELMARYRIRGDELAEYIGITANAMSNLKNAETMPRIDGERFAKILDGLNSLAKNKPEDEVIYPNDLFEYKPEK